MHECILKLFIQKLMKEPTVLCSVAALSDIAIQTFPQTVQIRGSLVSLRRTCTRVCAHVLIHAQKLFFLAISATHTDPNSC